MTRTPTRRLLALALAGLCQIGLGLARAGFIAAFFPSSVIKGLLAAIGVILILKQLPHVFGHDTDPEGDMSFQQLDQENTFSELLAMVFDIHAGAAVIGLLSIALLVAYAAVRLTLDMARYGDEAEMIAIPFWPFAAFVAVTALLSAAAEFVRASSTLHKAP